MTTDFLDQQFPKLLGNNNTPCCLHSWIIRNCNYCLFNKKERELELIPFDDTQIVDRKYTLKILTGYNQ